MSAPAKPLPGDDAYVARLREQGRLCWCCSGYGLNHADDGGLDGLCAACRGRSPSACQNAHRKTQSRKVTP